MPKKYFDCVYGQDLAPSVLTDTLNSGEFVIGDVSRFDSSFNDVQPGDVILLSVNGKIVAYGEAQSSLLPRIDHWKVSVRVDWKRFDSTDAYKGVSAKGVSRENPSNSRTVAKQVSKDWAEAIIKEFP